MNHGLYIGNYCNFDWKLQGSWNVSNYDRMLEPLQTCVLLQMSSLTCQDYALRRNVLYSLYPPTLHILVLTVLSNYDEDLLFKYTFSCLSFWSYIFSSWPVQLPRITDCIPTRAKHFPRISKMEKLNIH